MIILSGAQLFGGSNRGLVLGRCAVVNRQIFEDVRGEEVWRGFVFGLFFGCCCRQSLGRVLQLWHLEIDFVGSRCPIV